MDEGSLQGLVYTWSSTPAPRLNVVRAGGDAVLSWIVPSREFVLRQNSNLDPTGWTDVTTVPVVTNLQNQVKVPATMDKMFYRLVSP